MSETKPMTAAGHRILEAAGDLFYSRGITAVGVDLIAEHSGVTKRTLYNQFGSKDQLVVAYLDEREQRWQLLVRETIAAASSPIEAVIAPLEAQRTWNQSNPRGCAFINALAELPDATHPAHVVAMKQKQWLIDLFLELATAAGCSAPDTLATQLLVLHEGALVTQQLSLDTLSASIELARELVRAAVPAQP
ncbi:TetR/AcrR family transcriptional regulator [Salinibacterium sp. SWN1162]|uniref:TetR/AcrR family transcriptional regulator n=1 Tax=Salinibacterium sp. SWN1162 TaxID=2792053 RepID=UPI0018CDCDA9|nr:TetR/AcrR family transcriptional regulator [Salinibacterium sp. SWN1162]MBH0009741.1 TetR/AcrR family transcriptional regulator [Salinibacterium sp. SWN1162]